MSNILNAHLSSVNNLIPARRIKKEGRSRVLESPQSIYKYSIDDELAKKELFRQEVKYHQYLSETKKKRPLVKTIALVLVGVLGVTLFKKIKK